MKAEILITGISQLVTAEGAGPKHGQAMRELKIVEQAAIAISAGVIVWAGRESEWKGEAEAIVDVGGRAIVPGLIDSHTHAVWAGDRLADFEARTSGSTYEEILAAGGGITFPKHFPGLNVQTSNLAIGADTIDTAVLE